AEPATNPRLYDDRRFVSHQTIARLAEGATLEQANAAVAATMSSLAERYPDSNQGRGAAVARLGPVPGAGANGVVKAFLGLLMGFVVLILLVAAANVAGMLLARATAREKEVAIRLAIGSSRARLARQLLVETLVLALAGAAAGMLLASWATSLITTIEGPGLTITLDLSPDGIVFVFAFALAVLTGLFVGIVPALQSSRLDLASALKLGIGGARGTRARRAFVAVQVGVSVVLLATGALLARALTQAALMSGGFEPEGIHMTSLDLSLDGYAPDELAFLQEELRAAVASQPGVEAAALANDLPLDLSENAAPVWSDGTSGDGERGMGADFNAVSPGYFETLRIPLIRGRDFDATDVTGAPVVVVSEALARRAWGGEDPIGRILLWGTADGTPRTIIGVVGEVKNQWPGETEDGMVYLPLTQRPTSAAHILARGTGVNGELFRTALLDVDPRLTLSPPQTLEAITAVSLLPSRLAAGVTALLGGLALFLSSLGVYGIVAHSVAQRRREIGVRLALGARAPDVVRMTIAGGFKLALPGLLFGATAAIGVAQLLRSLLFGVSPTDPLTLGAVAAVLTAAVGLASWIPGRRAAAVDPLEALSAE
ncbi:MAG TPA: FtsX-like permease family protein, partial [Candidatus Limnocylindrales bacterium]|nr:FtsX-like permease family protein [Candidatus Limnocylindrales bacterium]